MRPGVVLPDRALCLPTFCHLLEAVNKTSSSSSLDPSHVQPCMPLNTVTLPPPYYRSYTLPVSNKGYIREVVLRHGNPEGRRMQDSSKCQQGNNLFPKHKICCPSRFQTASMTTQQETRTCQTRPHVALPPKRFRVFTPLMKDRPHVHLSD